MRPKVSLTASHCSTLAEEYVSLLRHLQTLPSWRKVIAGFISSQLVSLMENISQENEISDSLLSKNYDLILASLAVLGGVDRRMHLGGVVMDEKG
ncbi:E3 ubiquitin-protein ligase HERC2, partial [Stegodyphus mimosarum]